MNTKESRNYRIIFNPDGSQETDNFQYLLSVLRENNGGTEGIVNPKLTPFPKKYKNKEFQAITSSGEIINLFIFLSKAGFVWTGEKNKNLNGRVMAWREKIK